MTGTLIHVEGLSKTFGRLRVLESVDFQVQTGQVYGLVGPDGAGKTTLIRLVCGVLKPDAGRVSLCGFDLASRPEQARQQLGYLAQRFALYEDLTVLENLQFFAEVKGMPAGMWEARSREILSFVGLDEFGGRRAGQLSGGMKQKLGLALALVTKPRVLLLDEPTTGVDPITRQEFWRLIIRLLQAEGLAVLVSTPYMDEATRCTRVGFLSGGRLISEGRPLELCAPLSGQILELEGEPQQLLAALAREDKDVENVQRFGLRLHLRVRQGQAEVVLQRLSTRIHEAGLRLGSLEIVEPQLEDVFIQLSEKSS